MVINVPESIAQRLEQLAQRQGRTVADILENWLDHYAPETMPAGEDDPYPPGSLAALAKNAIEADIHTSIEDTAQRSREILDQEFADYLKQRINRNAG